MAAASRRRRTGSSATSEAWRSSSRCARVSALLGQLALDDGDVEQAVDLTRRGAGERGRALDLWDVAAIALGEDAG